MRDFTRVWRVASPGRWTVVPGGGGGPESVVPMAEHRAGFGDFVRAYVEHLSVPWWRRMLWRGEWERVERTMRRLLDEHGTVVWIEKEGGDVG